MSAVRLLFVEDDATLAKVLGRELEALGYQVKHLPSADGAVELVRSWAPELALVDLKLPGTSGQELLARLREARPDLQVVVFTGHGGVAEAVAAMRLGAYDFLTKPTPLDVLEQTLARAAEKQRLLVDNQRLKRAVASHEDPYEILGASPAIAELRRLIERIGPTEASVLIQGENGTGKELVARHLHRASPRAAEPFVVLNCGAVPTELVESELFGHERGAFTGAERKRVGLFEAADGGTLFLDEVGELPLAVQPALLRVLQFGEIRPVGSTQTRHVSVRVLAATNRDLKAEVKQGRFREDLYYRLATFVIEVPPLRQRREDIELLATTFLGRTARRAGRELELAPDGARALALHDWPGNIRELDNAVTRLAVLAAGPVIGAGEVRDLAFGRVEPVDGELPTLNLETLERLAAVRALERHGGDKRAAAEELGISLRTLYYKLERWGAEEKPPAG